MVLLIRTKSFGEIWLFGEHSMGIYMGGRQIFETSQEVHKCYVSQTKGETNPNNLVISVLDIGKGCYSLP
jgi:hypothetical protein